MENSTIKESLDSLVTRGVLSRDGREIVMRIMLELASNHATKVSDLKNQLDLVRGSRDAALMRLKEYEHNDKSPKKSK